MPEWSSVAVWGLGGLTLAGAVVGAWVLQRMMDPQAVVYSKLEISDVRLTDGSRLLVEVDLSVRVPSGSSHAAVSERLQRVCTQSCNQVLSPYSWEDMATNTVEVHEKLKAKVTDNLLKADLPLSSLLLTIQRQ